MIKKKIRVKKLKGTNYAIAEQEIIGEGSFGKVVKAYKIDEPDKELVAKIIPISRQNIETIESEIKFLKSIPNHPNLINCLKNIVSSPHNFYLIMEYCNGGSFQKYLEDHRNCHEDLIWKFLREFCKGYEVLYDLHVVHRDIKPENILIHNGTFKIVDFGFSKKLYHHSIQQNLSIKGTPLYMAPELQFDQKGSSKLDMFSLGVVVFRFAYNQFPFYRKQLNFQTVQQYFAHLKKTPLKFPNYPARSKQLQQLIEKMLEKNSTDRLQWKQLFKHPKINLYLYKKQSNQNKQQLGIAELSQSIQQINRSSVFIKSIKTPFQFKQSLEEEAEELIQFTSFFTSLQIKSLQSYAIRRKVIIELIQHLNKIINTLELSKQIPNRKQIKTQLIRIRDKGSEYCCFHFRKIAQILKFYSNPTNTQQCILESVKKKIMEFEKRASLIDEGLKRRGKRNRYQHLEYQNVLYDFLNESGDWPNELIEQIKIPLILMMDLYDACLKLQTIAEIKNDGKVQLNELKLKDAELDRINYKDFNTYIQYLEDINEVTVLDVKKHLKKMGLLIQ